MKYVEESVDYLKDKMRPAAAVAEARIMGRGPIASQPAPISGTISLDTTPITLWDGRQGTVIDIFIQNLSVNTVYILTSENQPVTQGLKVVAGAEASKDNLPGDLIIVASAAASDVRFWFAAHGLPWGG
jgi:hypothetical protein